MQVLRHLQALARIPAAISQLHFYPQLIFPPAAHRRSRMPQQSKRSLDFGARSPPARRRTRARGGAVESTHGDLDRARAAVAFNMAWRILRAQGWYAKPPPGGALDNKYRYIRAGSTLRGRQGYDYFVGEEALLEHYDSITKVKETERGSNSEIGSCIAALRTAGGTENNDVGVGSSAELNECGFGSEYPRSRVRGGATVMLASGVASWLAEPSSDDEEHNYEDGAVSDHRVRGRSSDSSSARVGRKMVADGLHGHGHAANSDVTGENDPVDVLGHMASTDVVGRLDAQGVLGHEAGSGIGHENIVEDVHGGGDLGSTGGNASARGDVRDCEGDVSGRGRRDHSQNVSSGSTVRCSRTASENNSTTDSYQLIPVVVGSADEEQLLRRSADQSACGVHTPRARTPTVSTPRSSLQEALVGHLVAYTPSKESWMTGSLYRPVGTAYIIGRVCQKLRRGALTNLFEVRWLDSMFQSSSVTVGIDVIRRGLENYRVLARLPEKASWDALVQAPEVAELPAEASLEDLQELQSTYQRFEPTDALPASLAEVEAIRSMRFDPEVQIEAPRDLYKHSDGTTNSRLLPQYKHLFQHSASSSFFAYVPLYFWKQVVLETNTYANLKAIPLTPPLTLDELMIFLGILFYFGLQDKGEYSNYWGSQPEDTIFGGSSISLDGVIPLNRFKRIRQAFSIRADPPTSTHDPAARIRPLLNLLKTTGGRFIEVGRNLALDEASIACRSRYGRHMIVYNPMKPTGKYHFRLYVVCCATSWVALNYKLHCNSDIADRMVGVIGQDDAQKLREELEVVSSVRQHVLEVVLPLCGSNRVVNMDNYYTSVQLLLELRMKGFYARGTVRTSSKHFPKHTLLNKKDAQRGDHRQGVSLEHGMVAASWCDGSIVNLISNADSSASTTVTRQVEQEKRVFSAPACVSAYNAHMQGVDRLDQIRGRFSIADGHSFKKWHKKLAMAMVDIARANAFLTRRMAIDTSRDRDPHRTFLTELVTELLSGRWKDAPTDGRIGYGDLGGSVSPVTTTVTPTSTIFVSAGSDRSPQRQICSAVSSKQLMGTSRKRRQCVVCRWEDRYPTEVTDYCSTHNVCLCRVVYSQGARSFMCPQVTWTCWEKFHRFYLARKLFTAKGNLRRSSDLFSLKMQDGVPIDQTADDFNAQRPSVVRSIDLAET